MRTADFLCIGAQKAGTSWLDMVLRQHPDVFLPPMKEVHFFDFIYNRNHRKWIRTSFRKNARRLIKDESTASYIERLVATPRQQDEWYSAVFDHPEAEGRVCGEITPAYSLLPCKGIDHVKAINPDTKMVFIIREPVDRAMSQLRMAASRRDWSFVDAEKLEEIGILPAVLARSSYRENIARWESVFSPEQILYLPFEEIRQSPASLLRRVEDFLGLSPHNYRRLKDRVHRSRPVEVSSELETLLRTRLRGEREFLVTRFGADFVT